MKRLIKITLPILLLVVAAAGIFVAYTSQPEREVIASQRKPDSLGEFARRISPPTAKQASAHGRTTKFCAQCAKA